MATWDDVRRLALGLPETDEGTSWGNRSWGVRGKGFVWERPLSRKDLAWLGEAAPEAVPLGVRTEDLVAKESLLASDPDVFFTTPHFDGYPAVLVRLDRITAEALADVVEEAWLAKAPPRLADAYVHRAALLGRIGLDGAPPPDLDGLRTVHRAFVAAVPFEALAVQLGESEPLDASRLVARVLRGGRGGYCFEVNTVLQTLLEGLGFAVERREGIVGARAGDVNHLALVVQTPDGPYLADGGLGEGLLDPLPLRPGRVTSGARHADVERDGDGWWIQYGDGGVGVRVRDEPRPLGAFARPHKRLSTGKASGFVRTLVVQQPREDRIATLRARTYSETGPAVEHREVVADADGFAAVLRERFGIDPDALGRERMARLWERACAQHEAFEAG